MSRRSRPFSFGEDAGATRSFLLVALLLILPAPSGPSQAAEPQGALGVSAERVLTEAFRRRYDCTLSGVVEIETQRGGTKALRRRVHVASKFIEGRLHTYALFRAPDYIRGMAFLGIEPLEGGRDEERFVYLPSLDYIRRVGGSQSADSFLGTDLSYHDFERQRVEDYQVDAITVVEVRGETAYRVRAFPRHETQFAAVEHDVAGSDHAILATRYFKRDAATAFKSMEMPRADIRSHGECRVPTRIRVEDLQRRTATELVVHDVQMNPAIEDSLFSRTALETRRSIPGIAVEDGSR